MENWECRIGSHRGQRQIKKQVTVPNFKGRAKNNLIFQDKLDTLLKMRINGLLLIITAILGICSVVEADIYIIQLPVCGSYTMGQSRSFTIDLGTELLQINEVRLICEGTVTAGLDYWWNPFSDYFYGFFDTEPGYMWAKGPLVGASTYPLPEPFSDNPKFVPEFGATWDFLLDGQANGSVILSGIFFIPEFPPKAFPSGYLEVAIIQINAVPLLAGDFDRSGKVDLADFAILASAWWTTVGDPNYNDDCDISEPPDSVIDLLDLSVFCGNWLQKSLE